MKRMLCFVLIQSTTMCHSNAWQGTASLIYKIKYRESIGFENEYVSLKDNFFYYWVYEGDLKLEAIYVLHKESPKMSPNVRQVWRHLMISRQNWRQNKSPKPSPTWLYLAKRPR